MLLDAKNVSKAFGSFLAVSGADLAVDEHEIIGLIGPNGAGKSTFFNCLAGETSPTTRPHRLQRRGCDPCRAGSPCPRRHRPHISGADHVRGHDGAGERDGRRVLAASASQRRPRSCPAHRRVDRLAARAAGALARHAGTQAPRNRPRARHRSAPVAARRIARRLDADRIAGGDRAGAAHPRHGHHHRHRRAHHGSHNDFDQARAGVQPRPCHRQRHAGIRGQAGGGDRSLSGTRASAAPSHPSRGGGGSGGGCD